MSIAIEKRVWQLVDNNKTQADTTLSFYNRYTTDKLPIDERKTPKYINTSGSNIEEDQRLTNAFDSEIVDNRVNFVMSNPIIIQYDDENESEKDKYQNLINNWIKEDSFNMKLRNLTDVAGASGHSSFCVSLLL